MQLRKMGEYIIYYRDKVVGGIYRSEGQAIRREYSEIGHIYKKLKEND